MANPKNEFLWLDGIRYWLYSRPKTLAGAVGVEKKLLERGLKMGRDFRIHFPKEQENYFKVFVREGMVPAA